MIAIDLAFKVLPEQRLQVLHVIFRWPFGNLSVDLLGHAIVLKGKFS